MKSADYYDSLPYKIDNYCVAHDYLYIGFFLIKDIIVDTFASRVLHIKEINVDSEIRMS